MVTRNKTVFGLLVLATVCGVVAGLGAVRGDILPNAYCTSPSCSNLIWGNPPTDENGNPLPAGVTCRMSDHQVRMCVSTPTANCNSTGPLAKGCPGIYFDANGFITVCYQGINKC